MLEKLRGDKKGSIVDIAFLLVAVLGLAIFILIVGYVFPQITNKISDSEIGDNAASQEALNSSNNIISRFDGIFLIIFVGLSIAILITAFFIESSPILIPIYIIGLGLLITFAAVAQNIYETFTENPTFIATAATQPITNYIMGNLIMIAIGVGVLSMILMFSKPRGYGGGY